MPPSDPSAYLIDLDGTLYAEGAAIPGAVEAIGRLRADGVPFRLVTNTTSRSRAILCARLTEYGFHVEARELFTATIAGAELARERGYRTVAPFTPEPAHVDLADLELAGGCTGRTPSPGWRPDAVLIGDLGNRWTYQLMQEAFEYLMAGAELIAFSRDRYWLNGGRLALDAGPFVAALEYATGRPAVVAGKPSRHFFEGAVRSLGGVPRNAVAMVGDDLWSDVQGAQQAGLRGWLVQTGKFRSDVLARGEIVPDRVLASVALLYLSPLI
jgi:HAD superfamily hydrolase (TIGR01458 family)